MNPFARSELEDYLPPDPAPPGRDERFPAERIPSEWFPSVADAYKLGGLARMDQYEELLPHEQRRRDAAQRLESQPDVSQRLGPDWLHAPVPDPFGGKLKSEKVERALDLVGGIGAGMVVPQSWSDIPGAVLLPLKGIGAAAKVAGLAAPHVLEPDDAEAHGLTPRQAMRLRKARATRMGGLADETTYNELPEYSQPNPRAVIGGNQPPPQFNIAPDEITQGAAGSPTAAMTRTARDINAANAAWAEGLPTPRPAASSTDIPDIRGLPVPEAVAIARNQPHLVVAGEGSPGRYVGGPRDTTSKATLNATRRNFDRMVAEYPEGGLWYENYRPGISGTTNNTPLTNLWASKMHGQWSAGVSPEHELGFLLKELNSSIAGVPRPAYLGDQHEAFRAALAAKDPNQMRLSKKTDEYARLVNPDQGVPGATGVDDFRYGYVHGFRDPQGNVMDAAFSDAQHRYLDYETALAVDRFNETGMGGRSNWTGEQVQAAPWVVDKANDLQSRNENLSRAEALRLAMKTIVDFLPKHTYSATYEYQPGASVTGHLPGSVNAPQSVRDQFALDPQSKWNFAPGGRDAIYSGLGIEDTGAYMRVRPTLPMQGIFDTTAGNTEYNLGEVARPLGGFQSPKRYDKEFIGPREFEPFKRTPEGEQLLLDAGEAVRGYIDAQAGSSWHKNWAGGPLNQSGSLFFPRSGPASQQEMIALRNVAKQYGLEHVVDTGEGITVTNFYGMPADSKALDKALKQGASGPFAPFGTPQRTRVDSGYIPFTTDESNKWGSAGSGEATRFMLDYVNKNTQLRAAFNNNGDIAKAALDRMERDEAWAKRWGAPREDIQKAREIISQGPGWIDRLEAALASGVLLPATVAAIFAAGTGVQQYGGENGQL